MAIGVSLGGIILGNYLAEYEDSIKNKLNAAMLVSVCFDSFRGTESLEKRGLNSMLNRHLANCLVNTIKEAKQHFENSIWDLERVFSSKTIREFDERFTCRQVSDTFPTKNYVSITDLVSPIKTFLKLPFL